MSKSILQAGDKRCYATGRTDNIHKHHIYPGNNRATSDKHGFWVYLTAEWHNGNNPGAVHNNPNQGMDLDLKVNCQMKFEETHTRDEFMKLIGTNYLED